MVRYRRNFVPGGTYFFTVTLADRTSSALVDHVAALRMAFRIAEGLTPDFATLRPGYLALTSNFKSNLLESRFILSLAAAGANGYFR